MTLGTRGITRFTISFFIAVTVVSSPVFMFINPTQVSAASIDNNSNRIDSSGYHSTPSVLAAAASPLSSPTPMVPAATNQGNNGDFTTQAALTGVAARQTNNVVGVQSYYDVVFTTSTTGTIKFIDITFPAGTVIGASPLLVEREGIGAGTAAKTSATVIRYTVTSDVSVPAGTQIRLEFFNIVNPTAPSTGYKVTVTTRNAGGTAIDGPTLSNGFSMKQIGAGQIADGAITSTKPADGFMKRVTVRDTPAGHAVGWDPNAVDTVFQIAEPAVTTPTEAYVTAFVGTSPAPDCEVRAAENGFFAFDCERAPSSGVDLQYIVVNLPSHVVS